MVLDAVQLHLNLALNLYSRWRELYMATSHPQPTQQHRHDWSGNQGGATLASKISEAHVRRMPCSRSPCTCRHCHTTLLLVQPQIQITN